MKLQFQQYFGLTEANARHSTRSLPASCCSLTHHHKICEPDVMLPLCSKSHQGRRSVDVGRPNPVDAAMEELSTSKFQLSKVGWNQPRRRKKIYTSGYGERSPTPRGKNHHSHLVKNRTHQHTMETNMLCQEVNSKHCTDGRITAVKEAIDICSLQTRSHYKPNKNRIT